MHAYLLRRLPGSWQRIRNLYQEFPSQFWILVLGTFIDRLGGALLFPFFTLYLTRKFSIGMTQVGVIFGLYSISSVVGSTIGGALSDRFGRKGMLLMGLVMSALSSVLMGVINAIEWFFVVTLLVGVLSEVGGPAQQALVADLLPEDKRAQGFGILRVVVNLSVTIGPLIGGLLASRSYLLLFIFDAIASMITAVIIYLALHETRLPQAEGAAAPSMVQTFSGYFAVLRDTAFVWFLFASILMVLVYMQMNTTLAVYLRDVHGITERGFGYILSLNAAMVVLFQFAVTRRVETYRPLMVMAVGSLLYAFGFAIYGFVSWFVLFLLAMVIITIGEMFVTPVSQAIVARLAPQDMRGRYMAVYGFSWVIPIAIGPFMAGLLMDNFNPDWVWYSAGFVGLLAAGAYFLLEQQVGRSKLSAIDARLSILQQLEEGQITAEEANNVLAHLNESSWSMLTAPRDPSELQYLNITVSDLETGVMKTDLRLPVGLVNTVLYVGGHLSADLTDYDLGDLQQLISKTSSKKTPHHLDTGDERIEVSID